MGFLDRFKRGGIVPAEVEPLVELPRPPSQDDRDIEALQQTLPIGSQFEYLGRPCRVTKHFDTEVVSQLYYLLVQRRAVLRADYADLNGVIRQIEFRGALMRQIAAIESAQGG